MGVTWCEHNFPGVDTLEAAKQEVMADYEMETWPDMMDYFKSIYFATSWVYTMEVMECGMENDPSKQRSEPATKINLI